MVEILGVELAPIRVPWERRMQTIGVLYFIIFHAISPFFVGLIYLASVRFQLLRNQKTQKIQFIFCPPFFWAYTIWLWWDWRSPYEDTNNRNQD